MERLADEQRRRKRRRQQREHNHCRSPGPEEGSSGLTVAAGRQDDRILRALQPLSWLRRTERGLPDHFVREASCTVISSLHGQRLLCNTILPLALQSPPLLYATLAFSALHQATLRASSSAAVNETTVSRYVGRSLATFQAELLRGSRSSKAGLLATSLMLCLVSVASGEVQAGTWRIHAEGAKALLASVRRADTSTSSSATAELEAIIRFLSRWYLNLESLTSITASGLITGQCVVQDTTRGTIVEPEEYALNVCDDHFGYPTRLAMLFREIGASAWERRRQLSTTHSITPSNSYTSQFTLTQDDFDRDADELTASLAQISADLLHSSNGLAFYPGVRAELSEYDVHGFTASTEAYLSMARILIERRVRGMDSSSEVVQTAVQSIIRSIGSMTPSQSRPSPAVAVAPPLFVAGCEALDPADRQTIRGTFTTFCSALQSKNMERALEILESLWENDTGGGPDWLEFQAARDWDFLPY